MMIEKIVLDYLNEKLSVPCYMEHQEEMDGSYVIIEKTASSEENHINFATMTFQSYAPSLYESAVLNEEVKEAMRDIIRLDSIQSSKLNIDYNNTDTAKKQYRYQAVFVLAY